MFLLSFLTIARCNTSKFVWFNILILMFVHHRFEMNGVIRSGFVQDVINLMTAVPWSDVTSVTTGITGKSSFQLLLHYTLTKQWFDLIFSGMWHKFQGKQIVFYRKKCRWDVLSIRKLSQLWFHLDFRRSHTIVFSSYSSCVLQKTLPFFFFYIQAQNAVCFD